MTFEVFSLCYNEEFILPKFIHHYREYFDNPRITFFDNGSTDRSREIIQDMGCILKTYDTGGQLRDDAYLKIKNNAWKGSKADFVIVCDCDEFLEIPFEIDQKVTIINTKGYHMIGDLNSRMGVYDEKFCKHVCFSPKHIQEINYTPGCHSCKPVGNISGSKKQALLLHRKYISEEHVYNKHKEYEKRLSEFNKKYEFGKEYNGVTMESVTEKFEELRKNAKLVV